MNDKHFLSDHPCKHCGSRVRYKKSGNCPPCVKAAVNLRRGSVARIPLIGNSQTVIQSQPPVTNASALNSFDDLLGDLTMQNEVQSTQQEPAGFEDLL